MEERTKEEISGGKKDEEELLQAYLQGLEKAQEQGLTLPPTIVTPVTTSQESSGPVQPTRTQPLVPQKKKRKAEDDLETPAETLTTVAEKDVSAPSAKLTAKTLAAMPEKEIKKLVYDDVSHITWQDVMDLRPLPSTAIRNVLRPLLNPSVREKQAKDKAAFDDVLKAFNAVKNNIEQTGDWNKHYNGTSLEDRQFRKFLDDKGYTPAKFIKRVIESSRVAEGKYCTFTPSPRSYQICEVVIDLCAFYDDVRLRNMNIVAGITDTSLEVFHAGPGRG